MNFFRISQRGERHRLEFVTVPKGVSMDKQHIFYEVNEQFKRLSSDFNLGLEALLEVAKKRLKFNIFLQNKKVILEKVLLKHFSDGPPSSYDLADIYLAILDIEENIFLLPQSFWYLPEWNDVYLVKEIISTLIDISVVPLLPDIRDVVRKECNISLDVSDKYVDASIKQAAPETFKSLAALERKGEDVTEEMVIQELVKKVGEKLSI